MTRRQQQDGPSLPASVQPVHDAVTALTDVFCREHLNAEYAALCRKLAAALAWKRPSPLFRSRPHIWACAIVRTAGWVNLLDDSSQTPHLSLTEIDREFGVSTATAQVRSGQVRATLRIQPGGLQWTLPSRMEGIRLAPRDARIVALEQVLTPATPGNEQGPIRRRTMGKAKSEPKSPFEGRWHIVSMTQWDEDFINAEVQGFIEFDAKGGGEFQFGYVRGDMNCRQTTRDGEPAVEWTWDGNDEMDPAQGRGWAVRKGDELHGMIFFHEGDDSGFVARRAEEKSPKRRK
jgi:hypothetical protein